MNGLLHYRGLSLLFWCPIHVIALCGVLLCLNIACVKLPILVVNQDF